MGEAKPSIDTAGESHSLATNELSKRNRLVTIADELSIQLYSLREFGDLARQLAALAELGFKRVETVGGHLTDAPAVRTALDAHGMSAPTGHVNLADLRSRFDWVVDQANEIGIVELFMPAVPQEERTGQDADHWRRLGTELGVFAEKTGAEGIAFGYHNHDWELTPYPDGTNPLEHFFDGAKGSPLTFEADLAWIVRGGANPVAWMEREAARLSAVHVKDLAAEGANLDEDGWADIGAGTLDWPSLWKTSQDLGARWMVLEHDKPADPVGFARSGRSFVLNTIGDSK